MGRAGKAGFEAVAQRSQFGQVDIVMERLTQTGPARKWRPTFFLIPGAKKVGRHKNSHIDGLCLETPTPNTENGAFWPSQKRHSPPFFDDSARVCPRDQRTDRAGWSNWADRTDRHHKTYAGVTSL